MWHCLWNIHVSENGYLTFCLTDFYSETIGMKLWLRKYGLLQGKLPSVIFPISIEIKNVFAFLHRPLFNMLNKHNLF